MKRLILLAFCASLLWTGCSKSPAPQGPEQFDRYIFFSQQVESKASLIREKSDLNGKTIAVVGYKYPSSTTWDQYLAMTKNLTPNVFYTDQGGSVTFEELICDAAGNASYSPLQGWSNTRRYSFFACYPFPQVGTSVVQVDSESSVVPVIQYSMSTESNDAFKNSMMDVMVASPLIDEETSSDPLTFTFEHCLSCLAVRVKNTADREVVINNITLKVNGLQFHTIQIPIDGSTIKTEGPSTAANWEFSMLLPEGSLTLVPPTTTLMYTELDDKLIFIPQSEQVSITLSVTYTRPAANGHAAFEGSFEVPDIATSLDKGKKHMLSLNFTESIVEVEISKDGWNVVPDVDNTFN